MTELDAVLREAATRFADRPAVIDDDVTTHGALQARVDELADGLRAAGAGTGTVVASQLPNGRAAIELPRACWAIGAVTAPMHPGATELELASLVARLRPVVVLRDPAEVDALRTGTAVPSPPVDAPRLLGGDVAALLATSGSTGRPKLVAQSHAALAHKATQMPVVHGLDERDAVLMPAPMAHMSGLLNGILVPGVAGMACVPMARWRTDRALERIVAHGVTFMVGPPTFFVGLLDDPGFDPAAVASLRLVSSGGAGVTPAFVRDASARLGARVKRTYGSTEAPTVATSTALDDPELAATCDGYLLEGVEARLTGTGELCLRGPELFLGYLDRDGTIDPDRDADGWFHTGDLATLTDDGRLTITGRLKDLIIRGGENVTAAEVEAVLERHRAVRRAAVVGLPDDRLGECVAAFVVTDGPFDLEVCRAWFRAEGVARFKTPEQVEVLDDLPLLPSGKLDKAALRDR